MTIFIFYAGNYYQGVDYLASQYLSQQPGPVGGQSSNYMPPPPPPPHDPMYPVQPESHMYQYPGEPQYYSDPNHPHYVSQGFSGGPVGGVDQDLLYQVIYHHFTYSF